MGWSSYPEERPVHRVRVNVSARPGTGHGGPVGRFVDFDPMAYFAFSDLLALGVLRALHEEGVKVPVEMAVAGFDDIAEARYAIPSLTTVAADRSALARMAVDLLAELLDRTHARPNPTGTDGRAWLDGTSVMPHRLVVRESSRA